MSPTPEDAPTPEDGSAPEDGPGPAMIRTRGLTKRFGKLTAVDHLDLDVSPGDIYGFLGANVSGKTTTVRMLLGLVLATEGTIELLGQPMPKQARAVLPRVGMLVEGPAAYGHLSGAANLRLLDASGPNPGLLSRGPRIAGALEQVGLGGVGHRPVKQYSLGMRQRLGLAAALIRTPKLLVLDEPTNGLDPQGIREIRELLLTLNAAGTTIFLSSHLLAEIEQLCTRVGVLDRGRLVIQDELAVLQAPTGRLVLRVDRPGVAATLLGSRLEARTADQLIVRSADPATLNRELIEGGVGVLELGPERLSLEQIVLARTSASSDRVDAVQPAAEATAESPIEIEQAS
jgi:ABC-type multidrug transport system ATPase subunit